MYRLLDCIAFVPKPSVIDYQDGHFTVEVEISAEARLRFMWTPKTFLESMAGGNTAVAKWQAEQREAVEFIRVFPQNTAAKLYGS